MDISIETLQDISNALGFKIIDSKEIFVGVLEVVYDPDDLQILQDAISVSADILLTRNIKDFDVEAIYQEFHIQVLNSLPREILQSLL